MDVDIFRYSSEPVLKLLDSQKETLNEPDVYEFCMEEIVEAY